RRARRARRRRRGLVPRPHEALRRLHRGGPGDVRRVQGRDLRPARAERRRQVDDVQDAVRALEADRRHGCGRRLRSRPRRRRGEAAGRLHGAEVLAVWAPVRAAEPRILRRHLSALGAGAPRAYRRDDRDVRARAFPVELAERPAARLQAAPRARLRADASAGGAVPRRADLGRRSDHAPGVLDAHQRPGPEGRDDSGHDALHGRGRVLRSRRDDRSGPPDRRRAAGRAEGACRDAGVSCADDGGRVHRDGSGARRAAGARGVSRGDRRTGFSLPRLAAIVRKESLQVVRDPSNILIAFVLPVVLLFLFAFAVSLDVRGVAVGVAVEGDGAEAREPAAACGAPRYFDPRFARRRRELEPLLVAGELRGIVVIPQDFSARAVSGRPASVLVLTDGSSPNTASFVANYARGVVTSRLEASRAESARGADDLGRVIAEPRFWYNPDLES